MTPNRTPSSENPYNPQNQDAQGLYGESQQSATNYSRANYGARRANEPGNGGAYQPGSYSVPPMSETGAYAGTPGAGEFGGTQAYSAQQRRGASQYSRNNAGAYRSGAQGPYVNQAQNLEDYHAKRRRKKRTPLKVIATLLVLAVIGVGGYFGYQTYMHNCPVKVTINGETKTIEGAQRSLEGLLDQGVVTVKAGNLVAVDESVLTEGGGQRCTAKLNGTATTELSTHLNQGDTIELTDGANVMEEYSDSEEQAIPFTFEKVGSGAVHQFLSKGETGTKAVRTGKVSGKTVDVVSKEAVNQTLAYYNVNTNGEKVIALTFDDGPWPTTTEEILDILKANGAKATFYTIGEQIANHASTVKRAASEGHEIATHTYDHASGSGQGVSLDLMSTAERQEEVTKGLACIEEVTGTKATTAFRSPGGNFSEATAKDLASIVSAEIGWNIDTEDWRKPGAEAIANRIKSAKPGSIILMHDGGGDRSQTVEALRMALPYLKQQGYKFVTVGELLETYPYQG